MKLVPYERIIYTSQLTRNVIFEKLRVNIKTRNLFFLSLGPLSSDCLYSGKIDNNSFRFVLNYKDNRNDFSPFVTGLISEKNGMIIIDIKYHYRAFAYIFALIMLGLPILSGFKHSWGYFEIFFPLFVVGLTLTSFNSGLKDVKSSIEDLLQLKTLNNYKD
jgi:hypothetical protein